MFPVLAKGKTTTTTTTFGYNLSGCATHYCAVGLFSFFLDAVISHLPF